MTINNSYVSVIIPTYKDWPRLRLCLEALAKQTYPVDQFEVIVVNNDPEETCPYELPAAKMKMITEANPGSYSARNAGIKIAKGEILAFTDSDCIPDKNWIEEGAKAFSKQGSMKSAVAGRIKLFFKNPPKLSSAETYEKVYAFPHQKKKTNQFRSLVTANVFIPKRVFFDLGCFEQKLYSGGDTEFGMRLIKNNYIILHNPQCIVFHPARYRLIDLLNKKRRTFSGKVYKEINLNQRSRIFAVFYHLIRQVYRFTADLAKICLSERNVRISDRLSIIFALIVIMISLFHESVMILVRNKPRRM